MKRFYQTFFAGSLIEAGTCWLHAHITILTFTVFPSTAPTFNVTEYFLESVGNDKPCTSSQADFNMSNCPVAFRVGGSRRLANLLAIPRASSHGESESPNLHIYIKIRKFLCHRAYDNESRLSAKCSRQLSPKKNTTNFDNPGFDKGLTQASTYMTPKLRHTTWQGYGKTNYRHP